MQPLQALLESAGLGKVRRADAGSVIVKLKANEVCAGMPVEVFVRTGERTAMNYFLKLLLDRLNRALTES